MKRTVVAAIFLVVMFLSGSVGSVAAQESLSLDEAVSRAESVAPEMRAALADSLMMAAGLRGARAFPNPALALGYSRSAPNYHVEAALPLDYPATRRRSR